MDEKEKNTEKTTHEQNNSSINEQDSAKQELKNRYKITALGVLFAIVIGSGAGFIATMFQVFLGWIFLFRSFMLHTAIMHAVPWQVVAFVFGGIFAAIGYFLVAKYAPESGGSGVPEIEGALDDLRPVRWWRVLPVKFIACCGTLGSGMILGREGPSIQIGANFGRMLTDVFRVKNREINHASLAVGASAGLTAAFNAPLASTVFIIEEMRDCFKHTILSISMVTIGCISSDIVFRLIEGQGPVSIVHIFGKQDLCYLWIFAVYGIFIGFAGTIFNKFIFTVIRNFKRVYNHYVWRFVLTGFILGGTFGLFVSYAPDLSTGGLGLVHRYITYNYTLYGIIALFILRFALAGICFGSGSPGGIFAPLLSVGVVSGVLFGFIMTTCFHVNPEIVGALGIVGMGALFGSTVRAPITGVILVLEITANYNLILPMLVTTITGYMVSRAFDTKPLYTALLLNTLKNKDQPGWR